MASLSLRKVSLYGGVLASLFALAPLLADDAKQAETPKPAPVALKDYGQGFAKFYKLGLPDAKGAEYVKFQFRSGYPRNHGMNEYYMRRAKVKGSGWLVEAEGTNAPHRYVSGVSVHDVFDYKVIARERKARRRAAMAKARESRTHADMYAGYDAEKASGSWKKVDAAADAAKIIAYVEAQSEERHGGHQIRQVAGSLFLGAAHLHRNGYTNEANRLVETLFNASDDRQQVILSALNRLADDQFEGTTDDFFEDLDWVAYQTHLLELLKRFRSGWQKAPAVKHLYTVVQSHLQVPSPPEIVGEGVSDEDQALARALCRMTQKDARDQRYRMSGSAWPDRTLWVLTAPESDDGGDPFESPDGASSNIIARIRMRGFDAVPLLMAMMDDNYLTCVNAQQAVNGGRTYYSSSSTEMSEERIMQLYNQLNRPATRGEIARAMLTQILPAGEDENMRGGNETDLESFKEALGEWYATNRGKEPLALARGYMTAGNRQQKRSALQYLSQFGSDEDFALVEQVFLEGEHYEYAQQITQYIQQRGDKAAAFVTVYTNSLMEIAAEDEDMADWVNRTIKGVEQIVSAGTLDEMLEDLVSGKSRLADVQGVLPSRLWQARDADEARRALLSASARISDVNDAATLLGMVLHIGAMNSHGGGRVARSTPRDPSPDLELWKALVADPRMLSELQSQGVSMTLGDRAAWTLEYFCADEESALLHEAARLGKRLMPLIRQRAMARLDGKAEAELPALPSADNVSEEDIQALLARLVGGEPNAETMAGASLDALLALREPFTEQSNLWSATVGVAHRIGSVEIDESLRDELSHLLAWKGQSLQSEMLDRLIADALSVASSGKMVQFAVARQVALEGIAISVTRMDTNLTQYAAWANHSRGGDTEGRDRVSVRLAFPTLYKSAQFSSEAPAADADVAPDSGDDDALDEFMDELVEDAEESANEDQAELRKAFAACCVPQCDVYPSASVRIVAMPAAPAGSVDAGDDPF